MSANSLSFDFTSLVLVNIAAFMLTGDITLSRNTGLSFNRVCKVNTFVESLRSELQVPYSSKSGEQ